VFPVKYNEKFYKEALEGGEFTKLGWLDFGLARRELTMLAHRFSV
jgi:hypothetical protein